MKRLWNWALSKALTWDQLKSFGESSLFRSANYALFAVPAAVKLLAHVPPKVHLLQFTPAIRLNLQLPFSWKLLFASAVLASAGNLVYWIFCPGLVRRYRGWADFSADGRNGNDLDDEIERVAPASQLDPLPPGDTPEAMAQREVLRRQASTRRRQQLQQLGVVSDFHNDFVFRMGEQAHVNPSYFNALRDAENVLRPRWRTLASVLYVTSSALITWILLENVWAVVRFIWHGQFAESPG